MADIGQKSRFQFVRPLGPFFGGAQLADQFLPRRDVAAKTCVQHHFPRFILQKGGGVDDAILPILVIGCFHPYRGFFGEINPIIHHPDILADAVDIVRVQGADVFLGGERSSAVIAVHRIIVRREQAAAVVILPVYQARGLYSLTGQLDTLFQLQPLFVLSADVV